MNNVRIKEFVLNCDTDKLIDIINNPVEMVLKIGLKNIQQYFRDIDIKNTREKISTKYIYNILDNSMYEDNESIKQLWANLLLNSMDADKQEPKKIFINILSALDARDAKTLNELIVNQFDMASTSQSLNFAIKNIDNKVQESIVLLKSLGLIDIDTASNINALSLYSITSLGKSFYSAVNR